MYAQADWGPKTSPAADERMNKFINRAYNLIALEAPFLFFEDIVRFATEPDALAVTTVDTITFATNPDPAVPFPNSWVVFQTNAGATSQLDWPTDRTWDGRVIGIQDANGVWHRNIIRTVWQDPDTPEVPAVPAVAARAFVEVNDTLGGGLAGTSPGDAITLNSGQPQGGDLLCDPQGLPYPTDTFFDALLPTQVAAYINGPGALDPLQPPIGPSAPIVTGGFNDPAGSFIGLCSASYPPGGNIVNLTAVVPGAIGNTMTVGFVGQQVPNAVEVSSPTQPAPSAFTFFGGGADEIPAVPAIPGKKYMSFWMPWDTDHFGPGPFNYRVYTEEYPLPDDIIEVRSTRLWKTNNSWPLQVLGQEDAERQNIIDRHTDLAKGIPRVIYRRKHYQMPAPAVPPDVELWSDSGENRGWVGPDPAGTFEYKITYCWGARDIWFRNPGPHHWGFNAIDPVNTLGKAWDDTGAADKWGKQRYREPRWESAPSSVSAQTSPSNWLEQGTHGKAVRLTLPNIEYIQGFFWKLLTNSSPPANPLDPDVANPFSRMHLDKSGWFVRVYRRRVATNFTNYDQLGAAANPGTLGVATAAGPILHKIEEDNSFYLLSEVHIDQLNEGYFVDDGQLLPDYHRRIRDTHGYMQIGMYPVPNKKYEVEVRCVRRPVELTNDADAPYIHAEACDILVDRALQLLYESEGNASMMGYAKGRYERNLLTLSKRYGDLRPSAVPVLKRLSRASPGYRSSIRYRQWWNTATD